MKNASHWFPPNNTEPKKVEKYLYHMYFTTYAFWIGILAATLHVTLPNPPSIVADAAFAITFGVLVVGSGIAGDWGARLHSMYKPPNLISHVLPFLVVLGALKARPSTPSALWKICVAASIPGLMYEFSCGKRANSMYKRLSPTSDTSFMIPILFAATMLGALVRSYV